MKRFMVDAHGQRHVADGAELVRRARAPVKVEKTRLAP
jgi:hypothetical protein